MNVLPIYILFSNLLPRVRETDIARCKRINDNDGNGYGFDVCSEHCFALNNFY